MPFENDRKMRLFYRKYGDPKNKPIVVIFGLLGVSENWDFFGKRFADLGYYVLVPDVRNHGQSPHSDVFNYDVLAGDIKQMIDEENIKKCYLLGHSMGGKIAMRLAFDYPEMVEKLEILDISPRAFDHPMEHVGFISAMSRIDLSKVEHRSDVEAELSKENYERRLLLFLMKNLSYSHENGYRWKPYLEGIAKNIAEIGKGFDEKYHYDGPTLFVRGAQSDYIIEKDYEYMKHHFPNYKMVTLEDAGHWIHVDDPEGFNKATEDFFVNNVI